MNGQFEKGIAWAETELAEHGYENAPTNVVLFAGFGWLDKRAASRATNTLRIDFGSRRWATVWASLGALLSGVVVKVFS